MGFGYNPSLSELGERLDILSFFSWMKRMQKENDCTWIVYDASGYAIVNKMSPKNIEGLGRKPTAQQILDVLVTEQTRPKRAEVMKNCDLRGLYLLKAIDICEFSNPQARYVDSRKVWREDSAYATALDFALDYVDRLKVENPRLVEAVLRKDANAASQLYLPLEISEAIYLEERFSVRAKFGPTTEQFFDQAIIGATAELGMPYQTLRCAIGPRKPGYLPDENSIRTKSDDKYVRDLLRSDASYKSFVDQYLAMFRKTGESLEATVSRTKDELQQRVI
ncbi:hypothetical protein HZB02_05890 [Candidatus Woesearchaeota archaeon]|nr:hypothetical protein [Candidatus Woesearchaeota archaeon]